MNMRPSSTTSAARPPEFPDAACLAALRAWYAGLTTRSAVTRYLPDHRAAGQSARGILGRTRRQLIAFARSRQRADFAALFEHPLAERFERAKSDIRDRSPGSATTSACGCLRTPLPR